jgi:hypothetical protein
VHGWLACVYQRRPCSRSRAILAAYARLVVAQLQHAPVTHSDLAAHPRLVSLKLVRSCPLAAVAIATYTVDGQRLQLHPDLVLDSSGWKVFDVPEYPAHIPLPAPLRAGDRPC